MINQPLSIFKTGNLVAGILFVKNRQFRPKINPVGKRGEVLSNLIRDKDKTKHWHTQILSNPSPASKKKNVFEKIYRPSKRENILNSVFIKNITDVLSTGDVAPDILGKGIEITGVKVSPCFRILNVFWQIPSHNFDESEEIDEMLNSKAFEIRSELISRNVVGRVPKIYFIRDYTNSKIAAFEEAMKEIDLGPQSESSIVPDDSFTKDIYSFKPKEVAKKYRTEVKVEPLNQDLNHLPSRPHDMKSNVFGLDHDTLMNKVIARKKKSSVLESTAVVSPESGDLFSKIPGEVFQGESVEENREKLLKQFHIQRKLLMKKKNLKKDSTIHNIMTDYSYDECETEQHFADEDFIEEE